MAMGIPCKGPRYFPPAISFSLFPGFSLISSHSAAASASSAFVFGLPISSFPFLPIASSLSKRTEKGFQMQTTILPLAWFDSIALCASRCLRIERLEPAWLYKRQRPLYLRWLVEECPRLETQEHRKQSWQKR